jgi:hypothetical protein
MRGWREEMMEQQRGRLIVQRTAHQQRDARRAYKIYVDHELQGRLREGSVLEVLDLEPGAHIVQARLDWTGSPEHLVELGAGQTVKLIVEPAGGTFELWRGFTARQWIQIRQAETS